VNQILINSGELIPKESYLLELGKWKLKKGKLKVYNPENTNDKKMKNCEKGRFDWKINKRNMA
jgi:hypothetical protein